MTEEYFVRKRHFTRYYARYPCRRFIEVELIVKRDGKQVSRDWLICGETSYVAEVIFKYLIGRDEEVKKITSEEKLFFEQLKRDRRKWGLLSRILKANLTKDQVLDLFAIRTMLA